MRQDAVGAVEILCEAEQLCTVLRVIRRKVDICGIRRALCLEREALVRQGTDPVVIAGIEGFQRPFLAVETVGIPLLDIRAGCHRAADNVHHHAGIGILKRVDKAVVHRTARIGNGFKYPVLAGGAVQCPLLDIGTGGLVGAGHFHAGSTVRHAGEDLVRTVAGIGDQELLVRAAVVLVDVEIRAVCGLFAGNVEDVSAAVTDARCEVVVIIAGAVELPDVVNGGAVRTPLLNVCAVLSGSGCDLQIQSGIDVLDAECRALGEAHGGNSRRHFAVRGFVIAGTRYACLGKAQEHPAGICRLCAGIGRAVGLGGIGRDRRVAVVTGRTPGGFRGVARVAGGTLTADGSLAIRELRAGLVVSAGVGDLVPVADDIAAVCVVAVVGVDIAAGMYRVRHGERIHIVIEGVEIAPAHQSRASRERLVELVRAERHAREAVVLGLDIGGVIRIAEDQTVLVQTKGAVRDRAVVRTVAARQELVIVRLTVGGLIIIGVSHKGHMIHPEVLTGAEIHDDIVIAVGVLVVLHLQIADDDVVALAGALLGAEGDIVGHMAAVAADDGLVVGDVDPAVRVVLMVLTVGLVVGTAVDLALDDDGVGRIGFGVFLQVRKARYFDRFAKQTADVSRLDAGAVVLAVAGKALEPVGIEEKELIVCAGVLGERHAGRTLGEGEGGVGVVDDLIIEVIAEVILRHGDNEPVLRLVGFRAVKDDGIAGGDAVAVGGEHPAGLDVGEFEVGAVAVGADAVKAPGAGEVIADGFHGEGRAVGGAVLGEDGAVILGSERHELRRIIDGSRRNGQRRPPREVRQEYRDAQREAEEQTQQSCQRFAF